MSFMINREKKLRKSNIQDGAYLAEIIEVKQGKSDSNVRHVKFKLLAGGEIINNRYVDNPDVYTAFDVLIDAALGEDSCNINSRELIGHYVKVLIANEGRFTNVKKIYKISDQDKEEIEDYQDDDSEDEEDENTLDDDSLNDDELELELEEDSDPEDESEEDQDWGDEKPRRSQLSSGFGRRRRSGF